MIDYNKVKCPSCGRKGSSRPTGLVKYSYPAYHEFECTVCAKKFDVNEADPEVQASFGMSDNDGTSFLGGFYEREN